MRHWPVAQIAQWVVQRARKLSWSLDAIGIKNKGGLSYFYFFMTKATRASTLIPHINPKQSNAGAPTLKWKWRYETSESYAGPKIKARGKLITDSDTDGDGLVNILGIKGKRNGDKITGLYPAGTSIPGNSPYEGDNLIAHDKTMSSPQLTGDGLQFSVEGGGYSNIFFADFLQPQGYLEFHSVPPYPEGSVAPNSETSVIFHASLAS